MFSKREAPSDRDLRVLTSKISEIIFSQEFILLKKELEEIYKTMETDDNYYLNAFKDALFTLLVEDGMGQLNTQKRRQL